MKTCEEYVLNELERKTEECELRGERVQELERQLESKNVAIQDYERINYNLRTTLNRVLELIELTHKSLSDNLEGLYARDFIIYNDDDKETFDLLKEYAKEAN